MATILSLLPVIEIEEEKPKRRRGKKKGENMYIPIFLVPVVEALKEGDKAKAVKLIEELEL